MAVISIIANFYKSEKFIPKLIGSVLMQTFQDWELICVNDCSPMEDLKIIRSFADKDNRIIVVDNQVNMGISKAKFEGIKYANGKYLMFIDGDDWLEPEALERCYNPAEKYECDMVIMSSQKVLKKGIFSYKTKDILSDCNRLIEQPELFDKYYINFFGYNLFPVTYWGKLIRKDAFDRAQLSPSPVDFSEDEKFNMYLFPHLRSMYMIDYIGYNWRWGGITSGRLKTTEKRVFRLLNFELIFFEQRLELLKKYNYQKGYKFLTIELINYLVLNFATIAKESQLTETQHLFIASYLNTTTQHLDYVKEMSGEKYDVIRSGNPNAVYQYCRKIYKQDRIKRYINQIIHRIIFGQ